MTDEERELYAKHLAKIQKTNPKVTIVLDVTKEDADWLKKKPPLAE